jgi:tetratricopeptide (TPR) repeat protein
MERNMNPGSKANRRAVFGAFIIAIFAIAIFATRMYGNHRDRHDMAEAIASLGPDQQPETIEGLRTALAAYERQIEAHIRDAAQTAVYWKILSIRLQDRGLHNEALNALERALYFAPADPVLHYLVGVSAGFAAKYFQEFTQGNNLRQEQLFALAENGYLRAIELDSRYLRPRFGLAILYIFELDRPAEAIPHMERYLDIARNDLEAMFILARAYYMTGAFQRALDLYDRIIALTRDENTRNEARANRRQVLEAIYG